MSVERFPGNLRVGVLHEEVRGVSEPEPQPVAPKEMLLVLLNGHQRFRIDAHEFLMSTEGTGPTALLLRISRPAMLHYLENHGAPLSKVAVTTDPDWLTSGRRVADPQIDGLGPDGATPVPDEETVTARQWAPSAAVVALAAELVSHFRDTRQQPRPAEGTALLRMSRGLELYRLAQADLGDGPAIAAEQTPDHPKIAALRRYVAAHLTDPDLDPDRIARDCGIGLRSLQRLCRARLDCSLADFIRSQRFAAAAQALRQGQASVAQAAFIAGYSSPANFSTAFKREYGVPPRFLRQRQAAR